MMMNECPEPGIYFDFPEDEYHKIPALGSTNLKDLLCNPVYFWARSWMNPNKEEGQDSFAKILGSAYHTRILEGKEKFYSLYAVEFNPEDHPEALNTSDDIKDRLRELKADGFDWIKLTGKKDFMIEQLLQADDDALIMDQLMSEYVNQNEGKTFLSQDIIDRIEFSAAMIEKHPQLSKCFSGGYAEVTIIWEHPKHKGLMLKARIDYLKLRAYIDLKTFANQNSMETDRAIYREMANYKYHIQAAHYWDGLDHVKQFVAESKVFGDVDKDWIEQLGKTEEFDMFYVFQQKGIAPLARGKKFPRSSIYQMGARAIEDAVEAYIKNLSKFGTDQWVDLSPITDMYDDEFPPWIGDV